MTAPTKENPGAGDTASEESRSRVDLDSIVKELGEFGPFQLMLVIKCAVVAIFAAWSASEYLFTTARISTRCLIPECESSSSTEWYPPWVYNAIPGTPGALDNCQRFAGNSSQPAAGDHTCPATLFDQNTVQDCEGFVYENTNTIVYDYGLACDEWRRTLIGSLRTVGNLVALPIMGYISDHWGRRTALIISAFNSAWLGVTRYWADTYIGFVISEVVESTIGSGVYTSAYVLLIEVMGTKYRTAAAATLSSFWAVGQMTLGLIAWGVPNWKHLTLALYIPQFLAVTYFWLMPESPRWYMSKGKYKESEAVLCEIARVNGKQLSPRSLQLLRRTAEEEKQKKELVKEQNDNEPWLIVLVFRHKSILLRCIVAPVWWITNTFIYYGLSINSVNILSGNRYLNYVAVSAVEIPGFWTAMLLIGKIGRKPVLTGAFWVCAACQMAYIFIPNDYYGMSLAFYLIGKYAIANVALSLYVYTAELYPTKHRHSLFAFTSMVGRIGAIVAPLTPAFGEATFESFPFVLFGSFALISGCLLFLTPETLGTKLPDTMEEAENLYKRNVNTN